MRAMVLGLVLLLVGCGDATGPAIEEECRPAGRVQEIWVDGVKVDSLSVEEYTLCLVRETYQLPLEAPHEG